MIRMLALAAMGVCAFFAGSASAAELKLLSALVMKPAISELSSDFEHTTGHKLTLSYDSAGAVKNRLQAGEAADVVIIQKPAVEELIKEGKLIPRSNIILARSGVAAAVARGAPRPDISSTETFKLALLAARSIAYPIPDAGHASGIHFRGVIERLGIAKEVNAKAKFMEGSVAEFAAHDSADIVISQPMEILAAPAFDLVGWLPPELQDYERFTWAMGITATSKEPDAADALVKFLSAPAAASIIKAKGMEPGS